jgi:hypothetical protein
VRVRSTSGDEGEGEGEGGEGGFGNAVGGIEQEVKEGGDDSGGVASTEEARSGDEPGDGGRCLTYAPGHVHGECYYYDEVPFDTELGDIHFGDDGNWNMSGEC